MPPISPLPTDLAEESDNVPSGNIENSNINMSDSDSLSDNEVPEHYEYSPLSQDPENVIDIENIEEGYDSGMELEDSNVPEASNLNLSHSDQAKASCSPLSEFPPMDEEHIETIKSVMKGIKLPSTSLPSWATQVPEEEWKAALLAKMQKRENKNVNNEAKTYSRADNSWCDFSSEALR